MPPLKIFLYVLEQKAFKHVVKSFISSGGKYQYVKKTKKTVLWSHTRLEFQAVSRKPIYGAISSLNLEVPAICSDN